MFFLPNNKPFGRAVCHSEETIKTSAVTIRRATKFIAMLRPLISILKFTTVSRIFFLLGKICCRAGSKETFLKVGTLSVKARAYPRQIKTNKMNFKNATISSLKCYYGNFVIPIPFRAQNFKHAHLFCRYVKGDFVAHAPRKFVRRVLRVRRHFVIFNALLRVFN